MTASASSGRAQAAGKRLGRSQSPNGAGPTGSRSSPPSDVFGREPAGRGRGTRGRRAAEWALWLRANGW